MDETAAAAGTSGPFDFTGRTVLVTGGARGVGRGIAEGFLAAGADVVVCGRTDPGPDGLPGAGGRVAHFVPADVRDHEQAAALVAATVDLFGRLDVLVNNAGGSPAADAATVSPRFFASVVALNLLGPFACAQAANRVMQDQPEGGAIVNVSSISGSRPSPGTAAYGAAKAGLDNLTRSLAIEWAPHVRVNAVVPGLIATEAALDHYGGPEGIERVAATVPAGRMGTPADVATACLFLASPAAGYISGTLLRVDGGGERPPFLAARAGGNP